jgi:drug/metabolite transporter (DMT)-like permease
MNKKSINGNNSQAILINLNKQYDEDETKVININDKVSIKLDNQDLVNNNLVITINQNDLKKKILKRLSKLRGIVYGLLAAFTLSLSKTIIKKAPALIGSDHSFIRYILQFCLLFIVIKHKKLNLFGPNKPSLRKLLKLRGIFGAIGMVFLHFAITFIAPSDTVAIAHCSVIITSILARLFLNEKFTMAHLISLILILLGILFICQPSFIFTIANEYIDKKNNINNQFNSNDIMINNNSNISFFINDYSKCLNNTENIELIKHFLLKNKTINVSGFFNNNNITFECNEEIFKIDLKESNLKNKQDKNFKSNNLFMYIGILLALLGALTIGIVETTIKKLCIEKVHYSISIIYGGYFGIPISLLISIFFYSTGLHAHSSSLLENGPIDILIQIGYSFLSGFFGVMAQLFLNFALAYEDASKIAIFKTTDLIFTFLFQFYLIGIKKDINSSLGAFLILFGTFLVLVYKFLDKKLSNKNVNNNTTYSNIFLKILFLKF